MGTMRERSPERSKPTHLHVVIVTGDKVVYDGAAERIVMPATEGQITVLLRHTPLLAMLEPGELIVRGPESEEHLAVGGGLVEVRDDQVIVLADSAEKAADIDVARAEAARERALAHMRAYRERPEYATALQAWRRSRARLKVARRALGT